MNIELYIEDKLIELDENVTFAITKQFEDLSSPTDIINDWTKTINIPFSDTNNRIFGGIFSPDRRTIEGDYTRMGIFFDPTKKLDFRLLYNESILMVGYAKMSSIKQKDGKGTYEINLFGSLGKVFQEMKKITFDKASEDTEYIIDGSQYVNAQINRELVASSWESSGQQHISIDDPNIEVTDIIGFAPNNSYSEGFDYKTYEQYNSSTASQTQKPLAEVLGESFKNATGIEASSIIGDGVLPRDLGEFRSYLQFPFIYWNKLWQIFQKKAESVTGYKFQLSPIWFRSDNPYWYNLVYMLKRFSPQDAKTVVNIYNLQNSQIFRWNDMRNYDDDAKIGDVSINRNGSIELVPAYDFTNQKFILKHKLLATTPNPIRVRLKVDKPSSSPAINHFRFSKKFVLFVSAYFTTNEGGIISGGRGIIASDDTTFPTFGSEFVVKLGDAIVSGNQMYWDFDIPTTLCSTQNCNLTITGLGFGQDGAIVIPFTNNGSNWNYVSATSISAVGQAISVNITENYQRSDYNFTLDELWNNDYNIFEEIIKYCKMYRILISVDEIKKVISFTPATEYFSNYTISDWSSKLDMTKDFSITPITFDNKYILFNYEDAETKLGEDYRKKYGFDYGEKRIATSYNFNTDTKELFKGIPTSIVNTDNVLSWNNLTSNIISYSMPSEIFVYSKDEDGKCVDNFGAFYLHNGYSFFDDDPRLRLRSVSISDDSNYQYFTNTYFYEQHNKCLDVLTYPYLDISKDFYLCTFGIPKAYYTNSDHYSGKKCIYDGWSNYLNERYSIYNKKVTCYLYLTPADFIYFDYNHFITIGNQLYAINKIYDYDVTSLASTKVDLISIQNVDGYTTDNWEFETLDVSTNQLTIPYDHYKKIVVTSSAHWELRENEYEEDLVVFPTEGEAGTTEVIIGSINQERGHQLEFEIYKGTYPVAHKEVSVSVGGYPTITTSSWFNEIPAGSTGGVDITSSKSWRVMDMGDSIPIITISPTFVNTDVTLTTHITISVAANSPSGVEDYYLENDNGDIVSFRVYVPNQS